MVVICAFSGCKVPHMNCNLHHPQGSDCTARPCEVQRPPLRPLQRRFPRQEAPAVSGYCGLRGLGYFYCRKVEDLSLQPLGLEFMGGFFAASRQILSLGLRAGARILNR